MLETYYTLRQVSEALGVDVRVLRRRVDNGELAATRFSERVWRVSETELKRFLARRTVAASPWAKVGKLGARA